MVRHVLWSSSWAAPGLAICDCFGPRRRADGEFLPADPCGSGVFGPHGYDDFASGTTINLFDYWVNPDDHLSVSGNGGINANHRFQFNDGQGGESLNRWTGGENPQSGIVNNTLFDGYPRLSGTWGGKSLRYLFDSSAQTGKTSHFGVTGLLQAQGGYYVYDSTHNYAAYNANKNAFDIYDTGGVGNSSHQVSSSRSTRQTRCSMRKTTGSSKMASRQTTPRATTVASPSTITSVSQCPRDSCSPTAARRTKMRT